MSTRRTILKSTLAAGALSMFAGVLGGLGNAMAQGAPRMRRSLHGMAPDDPDLDAYRQFVGRMQAVNQQDRVSWLQYSLLHGSFDTGQFRYCPHGDWYFLPWHRAYVLMYENAVRQLMQKPDFAMPYWDWTVDRRMPAAFTDSTYRGQRNPLYVPGRTLDGPDWPLPDAWVAADVLAQRVYAETAFQLFGTSRNPQQDSLDMKWVVRGGGAQGFLERTPHNLIHNAIGAYMPTAGSPRDPIFMMHHGNIDRIWARWNALGRNNTTGMTGEEKTWFLDMKFENNYLSPRGDFYSVYSRDMQSISPLGYTYPDLPAADNLQHDEERAQRLLALFATGSTVKQLEHVQLLPSINTRAATVSDPLVEAAAMPAALRSLALDRAPDAADAAEVFALIKDMQVGSGVSSIRVFVNAEHLTPDTPDSDPHFVTEIGFFVHGTDGHAGHEGHDKMAPSALVDLTGALRRLAALGKLDGDRISVHLLPVLRDGGGDAAAAQVVPAVVEIAVL